MTDFLHAIVTAWAATPSLFNAYGQLNLGNAPYGTIPSSSVTICRLTAVSGVAEYQTRSAANASLRNLDIIIQFDAFSANLWNALGATDAIRATFSGKALQLTMDGNWYLRAENESWQQEDQKIYHSWVQFRAKVVQSV